MQSQQSTKRLQLVNGSFTPSEVSNLILKSIDNQINNCKLKNLSNWIHDHNCDQNYYRNQIEQLKKRKEEMQTLIQQAQVAGCNLTITENFEIAMES